MSNPSQKTISNHLLSLIPEAEFAALQQDLEPLDLPQGMLISRPQTVVEYIYFPDAGIASVVGHRPGGHRVEVGIIGKEGFTGTTPLLRVAETPVEIMMQLGGHGHRIETEKFLSAVRAKPRLHDLMLRFVHVFHFQTVQTALVNSTALVDERLARWLLMCQDRLGTPILDITHSFLAMMLGVRRSSVTDAIHVLEGRRIIRADRGSITILERLKLEAVAGASYGPSEDEYKRAIKLD